MVYTILFGVIQMAQQVTLLKIVLIEDDWVLVPEVGIQRNDDVRAAQLAQTAVQGLRPGLFVQLEPDCAAGEAGDRAEGSDVSGELFDCSHEVLVVFLVGVGY